MAYPYLALRPNGNVLDSLERDRQQESPGFRRGECQVRFSPAQTVTTFVCNGEAVRTPNRFKERLGEIWGVSFKRKIQVFLWTPGPALTTRPRLRGLTGRVPRVRLERKIVLARVGRLANVSI